MPFGKTKKYKEELEALKSSLSAEQQSSLTLTERIQQKTAAVNNLDASIAQKNDELAEAGREVETRKKELVTLDEELLVQEFGLYEPRYGFACSTMYKDRLKSVRAEQKAQIKFINQDAKNTNWTVNGSNAQGRKMVGQITRLLVRAFNGECDDIVSKVKHSNIERSIERIKKSADAISKLGATMGISIPQSYVQLKEQEAYLAFEYAQAKQQEKEALREARALEREERAVQKEIEARKKALEKEQKKYQASLKDINKKLENEPDNTDLLEKKKELESELGSINKGIEEVDYREANKRAGFVYVISNIGAFGENVFKIGMTRRLEPEDRIKELSGASVPFNFDVHALVFTDDAPGLEAALHREFESGRINRVNERREFFSTTIDDIERVITENYDKTVDFTRTPDAEQYRISKEMRAQAS